MGDEVSLYSKIIVVSYFELGQRLCTKKPEFCDIIEIDYSKP